VCSVRVPLDVESRSAGMSPNAPGPGVASSRARARGSPARMGVSHDDDRRVQGAPAYTPAAARARSHELK
jgi:hypothetical protein